MDTIAEHILELRRKRELEEVVCDFKYNCVFYNANKCDNEHYQQCGVYKEKKHLAHILREQAGNLRDLRR
jgi:hypothetical protein